MSRRFRLVHVVPDPFLGARVPIAALVEHGGRVSVVPASRLPDARCLGSERAAALVDVILGDLLERPPRFDELPVSVGPLAVLDAAFDIPEGVPDPVAWVGKRLAVSRTERDEGSATPGGAPRLPRPDAFRAEVARRLLAEGNAAAAARVLNGFRDRVPEALGSASASAPQKSGANTGLSARHGKTPAWAPSWRERRNHWGIRRGGGSEVASASASLPAASGAPCV